jgi:Na+/proline symporter
MTTLYVPSPAPHHRIDLTHVVGVVLLAVMAVPPIGMAAVAGVFALAYGEVGLLALITGIAMATTLPAVVFAVAGGRARTSGQTYAWLIGCFVVAAVPLGFVTAFVG